MHGRIEQYQHARRRAVEAILERQPLWIFEKLRSELPVFWEADAQPIVHIKRGRLRAAQAAAGARGRGVVLVPYLAVLALFVLGLAWLPRSRGALLVLSFLAYYMLLHVATHGLPALPAAGDARGLPVRGRRSRLLVDAPAAGDEPRARGSPPRRLAWCSRSRVAPSLVGWFARPWPPPWFEGMGVETGAPTNDERPEGR